MIRVRQRNGASTRKQRAESITPQVERMMSPSHAELRAADERRQDILASAARQRLAQTASPPITRRPHRLAAGWSSALPTRR